MKLPVTSNAKLTGLCFPTASTMPSSSYCKKRILGSIYLLILLEPVKNPGAAVRPWGMANPGFLLADKETRAACIERQEPRLSYSPEAHPLWKAGTDLVPVF